VTRALQIGLTNFTIYLVVYHLHIFFYPDVHRDEETLYDVCCVFSASDRLVKISHYQSSPRFVPTIVGAHRDEDAPGGIGYILCPSIGLTNISTYLVVCHLHIFFTFFLYNFYRINRPRMFIIVGRRYG